MDTIRVNNQDARPLSLNSSDPDQQLSCGETAQLSVTGTYSSYLWSDGSNAATLTVSEPGDYAVSVSTANGCTQTGQISIAGEAPPEVSIQSSQSSICPGDPLVTLMATTTATGDYTISWSNGRTGSQINVDQASTYSVTVSTAAGCTATATFELLDCEGTQRCNLEAPVDSFFCGALDSTVLSSQSTISTLQSGDRFMAGDFLVEVTGARGTGTFNGTGIIEVPYLQGARLNVSLVNARINTDCQLIDGFVEVEGTGLKLLSDEMISALDDVLDGLETIDDVLEGAEDIIDAIDNILAELENYLPEEVIDSIVNARDQLIAAKNAYDTAVASGNEAAIKDAKDDLMKAKEALKNAQKIYIKAVGEFLQAFFKVVKTALLQLMDENNKVADDYDQSWASLNSLLGNSKNKEGEEYLKTSEDNDAYVTVFYQVKSPEELSPSIYKAATDYYSIAAKYNFIQLLELLLSSFVEEQHAEGLDELLLDSGSRLLEKVGVGIKNDLPFQELVNIAKIEITFGLNNWINTHR